MSPLEILIFAIGALWAGVYVVGFIVGLFGRPK